MGVPKFSIHFTEHAGIFALCSSFFIMRTVITYSIGLLCLLPLQILAQLTNGQIVHYPMDGNLLDASANSLHATSSNPPTPTDDAGGNANAALDFNGINQRIDLPGSSLLRPTGFPVSFSFWFKADHFNVPNHKLFITNFNTTAFNGYHCNVQSSSLELTFGDGTGLSSANRRSFYLSHAFSPNQWYQVVIIVFGPTTASAWIDCTPVSVGYGGSGGPVFYGNFQGHIGMGRQNTSTNAQQYFEGAMDEFRMWDRALTTAEVQQLCTISTCQDDSLYFQDSFCTGSSYFFDGLNLTMAGRYIANYTNGNGCDSVVVLDLTENTSGADTTRINASICTGENYFFGGATRSVTGRYIDIVSRPGNCDSVAVLQLIVQDSSLVFLRDTICSGQSYRLGNQLLQQSGTYSDTLVRLSNGCDSLVIVDLLVLNQADTLWVRQEGDPCRLGFVILRAIGPGRITWQNGQTTDTLVVDASGIYTVASVSSCGAHQINVEVEEDCLPEVGTPPEKLYIPNVFSPNGDGINETFWVQGNGILEYEIIIFNRWGGELYRSNRMDRPWDGTYEGTPVPDGVYLYLINYTAVGERFFQAHGFLTLFR